MGSGKSSAGGKMPKSMRQIIQGFWKETGEMRGELQSQMLEMLTTGGAGARVPIVSRAEEAQRRASSQALTQLDERLAQKGLAGTPFGEQIRSQQELAGRQAVAGVGPAMASEWIKGIPGYTLGAAQAIMGSLGGTRESTSKSKSWQI